MDIKASILLIVLFLLAIHIHAQQLSVAETSYCEDSSYSQCRIRFRTSANVETQTTMVLVVPTQWSRAISIATIDPTSPCSLTTPTTVSIKFNPNQKTVDCLLTKEKNTFTPPQLLDNQVQLPAIASYDSSFDLLPDSSCSDGSSSASCQARVLFPVASQSFLIETTSELTITCPAGIGVIHSKFDSIPDGLDIKISLHQYDFTIDPTVITTTTGSKSCTLLVNKSSYYTPYFKIGKYNDNNNNGISHDVNTRTTIFSSNLIVLNTFSMTLSPDCTDNTTSVCTVNYQTQKLQNDGTKPGPFSVQIPYFQTAYDSFPIWQSTDETFMTSQYSQRFLKPLTIGDRAVYKTNLDTSPVYVSGPFMNIYTTLRISSIIFRDILKIDYDLDICANDAIPFCRVYFKSKYVGYKLTLIINGSPFLRNINTIDNIKCTGNMTMQSESPNTIVFASSAHPALLNSNYIVSPPEGEEYMQCVVDFTIHYTTESTIPPAIVEHDDFYITSVTNHFYNIYQMVHFPLKKLPLVNYQFTQLPFSFELGYDCNAWILQTCTYIFTLSAQSPIYTSPSITTDQERQNIFEKSLLRPFTVPLYKFRDADTSRGEKSKDMVTLQVSNNRAFTVDFEIHDRDYYKSIEINPIFYSYIPKFDEFFEKDRSGNYLDVTIEITYLLAIPRDVITPAPVNIDQGEHPTGTIVTQDIYLLSYDGLSYDQPYEVIHHIHDVNFIRHEAIFVINLDAVSCSNKYASICFFTALPTDKHYRVSNDNNITDYDYGQFWVQSFVFSTSTDYVIDIDLKKSTSVQSVELLTPRVDEVTGELNTILQWNVTIVSTYSPLKNHIIRVALSKRLSSQNLLTNSFIRIDIQQFTGYYQLFDQPGVETREPLLMIVPEDYLFAFSRIAYQGDGRLTSAADCSDPTTQICTLTLQVYTNELYPGTTIAFLHFPTLFKTTSASYINSCTGISDTRAVADVFTTGYDPVTLNLIISVTTKTSAVSKWPLVYNTKLFDSFSCPITLFKFIQYPRPVILVLPSTLMNVNLLAEPASLYPIPTTSQIRRRYPALSYHPLGFTPQDDCNTPNPTRVICTLAVDMLGSSLNPLTGSRAQITAAEAKASLFFQNTFLLGKIRYPTLCLNATTPGSAFPQQNTDGGKIYVTDAHYLVFEFPIKSRLNNSIHMGSLSISSPVCSPSSAFIFETKIAKEYSIGVFSGDVTFNLLSFQFSGLNGQSMTYDDDVYIIPSFEFLQFINYNAKTSIFASNNFTFPRMLLGSSISLSYQTRKVPSPQSVPVTYQFIQGNITSIDIPHVLGDFDDEETALDCLDTITNETFAKLTTSTLLQQSTLTLLYSNYTRGAKCTMMLPVNNVYHNNIAETVFKHSTYSVNQKLPVFSYWAYPRYSPSAEIIDNRGEAVSDGNTASTLQYLSAFTTMMTITLMIFNLF